jgi:hypothetical protein
VGEFTRLQALELRGDGDDNGEEGNAVIKALPAALGQLGAPKHLTLHGLRRLQEMPGLREKMPGNMFFGLSSTVAAESRGKTIVTKVATKLVSPSLLPPWHHPNPPLVLMCGVSSPIFWLASFAHHVGKPWGNRHPHSAKARARDHARARARKREGERAHEREWKDTLFDLMLS